MADVSAIKEPLDKLKTVIRETRIAAAEAGEDAPATSPEAVAVVTELINETMETFAEFGNTLTPDDRARMLGLGIKTFGFVQTAYEHAVANPTLVPGYLDMAAFGNVVRDLGQKRTLLSLLDQFSRPVSDSLLADSDEAFHDALDFYNYVK